MNDRCSHYDGLLRVVSEKENLKITCRVCFFFCFFVARLMIDLVGTGSVFVSREKRVANIFMERFDPVKVNLVLKLLTLTQF